MKAKAKTKKRAPRKTLRRILNELDQVLASRSALSSDLWCVLTALRGPDDNPATGVDPRVKQNGTETIRRAAFPKTAQSGHAPASFMGGVDRIVRLYTRSSFHLRRHIEDAAHALNLEVRRED